jgi:hypothetical protein
MSAAQFQVVYQEEGTKMGFLVLHPVCPMMKNLRIGTPKIFADFCFADYSQEFFLDLRFAELHSAHLRNLRFSIAE